MLTFVVQGSNWIWQSASIVVFCIFYCTEHWGESSLCICRAPEMIPAFVGVLGISAVGQLISHEKHLWSS